MNLTPKEKANELVLKFLHHVSWTEPNDDYQCSYIAIENAKECAIIAVNLVLETNTFWVSDCGTPPEDTEDFWQKVKNEIENITLIPKP